jgi:cytochrome c biogenesis protein
MSNESEPKTESAADGKAPAGSGSPATHAVMGFLSSVKLAVILLILLALVSIIGTVLAQGDSSQDNVRFFTDSLWGFYNKFGFIDANSADSIAKYQDSARRGGLGLYGFSKAVGFDRLYSTWYFNLMLGLLSLNLVVCSLKHWPHTWRFFRHPKKVLEGEGSDGIPLHRQLNLSGDPAASAVKAAEVLAARGYRAERSEKDGVVNLFSQKGLWGRLGVYVTHAAILVIFLGGWIGLQYGKKGYMNIEEGTSNGTVAGRGDIGPWKLPFALRCDDFEVTYYEGTGRPKAYTSKLTVIENGREVKTKSIVVNDPLVWRGIFFYQSSYGETGKAGKLKIHVAAKNGSKHGDYQAPIQGDVSIPEFGMKLKVLQFAPDFAMENGQVVNKSNQVNNPAAAVQVSLPDGRVMSTWLFQNYPKFTSLSAVDFDMTLAGYQGVQYTGLQVTYDPGVNVIWLGCFLMMVGIFMAFFMPHRRVWVKIVPKGNKGGTVWVAGSTNKNRASFEEEFEAVAAAVKESLATK